MQAIYAGLKKPKESIFGVEFSATRLGDFLPVGQPFKEIFEPWQFLGDFIDIGQLFINIGQFLNQTFTWPPALNNDISFFQRQFDGPGAHRERLQPEHVRGREGGDGRTGRVTLFRTISYGSSI